VVVTSRRHLPALDGGSLTLTLDCLDPAEAVELLRSIVPAGRLTGQDDNLLRVAKLCGGLPLAVAILGAKLKRRKEWTAGYLADRVADRHQLFLDLDDGERDVRAAFQLSYDDLSDDQQRFFRMLGMAPGVDIDPERAAAVAAVEVGRADRLLEELLDCNLLLQRAPGRYRLHDLLSNYAGRLAAADAAELAAARERLLEWTARTAAARATDYLTGPSSQPGGGRVPSRDWYLREHDNLVATVSSAGAWAMPTFVRSLSATVSRPLLVAGYYEDALAVAEHWLAAAHEPGDLPRARLAAGLAKIQLGRRPEALADCRSALASFELAGDLAGQGAAFKEIGNILWYEGNYSEALRHYHEALPLQRTAGDKAGEATTLSNIGAVQSQLGRHRQALEDYGQALAIRRKIGDRVGMAQTLNNLGLAHERLGLLDGASTALTEALDLGWLLSDRALVCAAQTNLGNVYRRMQRFDEGAEHLEEAVGLAQELRNPRLEAEAENCLGDLLFAAGRNDDARESYEVALGLSAGEVDRHEEAHALEGLGLVLDAAGERAEAAHRWRSAAARYRELELDVELAHVEGLLGRRP
jgi:tetratricopeptide (TPR) repeat protein